MSPPPWTLTGRGWISLYRRGPAGLGALLLVRYDGSGVGPYDELMWIEAPVPTPVGGRASIRRIVVSTSESVDWGRRNWAIPKTRANFDWDWASPTRGQVRVSDGSGLLAHLAVQESGPVVPVTDRLLPPLVRTVAQPGVDGQSGWVLTCLGVSGQVRPARLTVVQAPGFVQTEAAWPLLSLAVPAFRMVFPEPARVLSEPGDLTARATKRSH